MKIQSTKDQYKNLYEDLNVAIKDIDKHPEQIFVHLDKLRIWLTAEMRPMDSSLASRFEKLLCMIKDNTGKGNMPKTTDFIARFGDTLQILSDFTLLHAKVEVGTKQPVEPVSARFKEEAIALFVIGFKENMEKGYDEVTKLIKFPLAKERRLPILAIAEQYYKNSDYSPTDVEFIDVSEMHMFFYHLMASNQYDGCRFKLKHPLILNEPMMFEQKVINENRVLLGMLGIATANAVNYLDITTKHGCIVEFNVRNISDGWDVDNTPCVDTLVKRLSNKYGELQYLTFDYLSGKIDFKQYRAKIFSLPENYYFDLNDKNKWVFMSAGKLAFQRTADKLEDLIELIVTTK